MLETSDFVSLHTVLQPETRHMIDVVGLPNCLIVPHIAPSSERTRDRMAEKAARNLVASLHGQPLLDPVMA